MVRFGKAKSWEPEAEVVAEVQCSKYSAVPKASRQAGPGQGGKECGKAES